MAKMKTPATVKAMPKTKIDAGKKKPMMKMGGKKGKMY